MPSQNYAQLFLIGVNCATDCASAPISEKNVNQSSACTVVCIAEVETRFNLLHNIIAFTREESVKRQSGELHSQSNQPSTHLKEKMTLHGGENKKFVLQTVSTKD